MNINKYTQATGDLPTKKGLRLKKEDAAHLMGLLNEVRAICKVDHKVEDLQVVFTGAKKETLIIIGD